MHKSAFRYCKKYESENLVKTAVKCVIAVSEDCRTFAAEN